MKAMESQDNRDIDENTEAYQPNVNVVTPSNTAKINSTFLHFHMIDI